LSADSGFSLAQLADRVGLSARNIRAHQARRLLHAPTRRGRQAIYDETHVRRLVAIVNLQDQGFNLASIAAILGVRPAVDANDPLPTLLHRLARERPALLRALSRHGVTQQGDDGTVHAVRPRALRSAMELERVRVNSTTALQVLTEVLDTLRPIVGDLVNAVAHRMLVLTPHGTRPAVRDWAAADRDAFATGVVALLSEAFRVAVEQQTRATVAVNSGYPSASRVITATSAAREGTLSLR
jgi:DNA-binding transcriptional MerR regulator